MTSPSPSRRRWQRRVAAAFAALIAVAAIGRARAADLDDSYLRGSFTDESAPVRWDGFYAGGQVGYSSMNVDFQNTLTFYSINLPNSTTNSTSYGGFFGYNWQVDPELVLGLELNYTRPSSLSTSVSSTGTTGNTGTASYKLVDFGAVRARAGYAFGQFLPYAVLGLGAGRVNYTTTVVSIGGSSLVQESRDNAYTLGIVGGLGMDVAILPNVFVRGEWEYVYFTPVKGITSSVNTARVGLGIRF